MIACVRRGCVDVARHIHVTSSAKSRRKGKRKFDNLTLSPLDTYSSMSHLQAFQTQGDTLHTKQMPSFRMSSLLRLNCKSSPFRYRSSLGSSTEREITASASFSGKPVQAAEAGSNRFSSDLPDKVRSE